ncbi:MAG: hypothetical protein C0417_01895 [Chlorobiaceae bacterium]|nr:hypothetical protein [Chlorobiaceae bacterium]
MKNNLTLYFFPSIIILLILYCTSSQAQNSDSSSSSKLRSSLQLDFIHANNLAYIIPINPSTRFRFGLDISFTGDEGNEDNKNLFKYDDPDTSYMRQETHPRNSNSFSGKATLSTICLYDFIKSNYFSIYAGVGPFLTYSRYYGNSSSSYVRDSEITENHNYNSDYSWTYGGMAVAGIQVCVTKDISVHTEYDITAGYQSGTSKWSSEYNYTGHRSKYINESKRNFKLWTFNGVIAGILFYF